MNTLYIFHFYVQRNCEKRLPYRKLLLIRYTLLTLVYVYNVCVTRFKATGNTLGLTGNGLT